MKINSKEKNILNNTSSSDENEGSCKQNQNDINTNPKKNDNANEPINHSYFKVINPSNISAGIVKIVICVFDFFKSLFIYIFPNSSVSVRWEIARLQKAKDIQVDIANQLLQRQHEIIEMSALSALAFDQIMEAREATDREKFLQEKLLKERICYLSELFNIQKRNNIPEVSNNESIFKEKSPKSILDSLNISPESKQLKENVFHEDKHPKDQFFNKKNKIELNLNCSEIVKKSRSTNPEVIALRKDLIRWMDRNEKRKIDLDSLELRIIQNNQYLMNLSEGIDLDRAEIKKNDEFLKKFERY